MAVLRLLRIPETRSILVTRNERNTLSVASRPRRPKDAAV